MIVVMVCLLTGIVSLSLGIPPSNCDAICDRSRQFNLTRRPSTKRYSARHNAVNSRRQRYFRRIKNEVEAADEAYER
jgi:hypothetical protein